VPKGDSRFGFRFQCGFNTLPAAGKFKKLKLDSCRAQKKKFKTVENLNAFRLILVFNK